MNFVILFIFSTIVFTVISKSTEDNTVNVGKSPEDNTVSEKSAPGNLNGRRNGEYKSEKVTHHSASNSNGKKLQDEDKSVRTHAKEIDAWIEELPQDQRYGARRAHGEWLGRAKGRETKLEKDLEQSRSLNVETIILPLLRGEIEDLETKYLPPIHLTKEIMLKDLETSFPDFKIPESIVRKPVSNLHYVRWRYILKNCANKTSIKSIKEILIGVGLDDDSIAKELTIFYEKASGKIHGTLKKLTVAEVKKGLIDNGMEGRDIINSILTIYAVPKKKEEQLMNELIK